MIKSKICDLLGIKYPIIQGGMAWVVDASLAAAVSNAGGFAECRMLNANGKLSKIPDIPDIPDIPVWLQSGNRMEKMDENI